MRRIYKQRYGRCQCQCRVFSWARVALGATEMSWSYGFMVNSVNLGPLNWKPADVFIACAPLLEISVLAVYIIHIISLLCCVSQVVMRSLDASFWQRAKALRARMNISLDPHSFLLYIKDLAEVSASIGGR